MNDVMVALERLDVLLAEGVARAEASFGNGTAGDPFRGLHISLAEVERLLARSPGRPLLAVGVDGEPPDAFRWLMTWFGLTAFDIDVVLIALAPELDLRYERLYAYLQDDVTRKRPTVELVLNLLTTTVAEKVAARDRFAALSPLVGGRIVRLVPPPDQTAPPLLAQFVKLDEQIVDAITGNGQLDARLAAFCRLRPPTIRLDDLLIAGELRDDLVRLTSRRKITTPIRLHLQGARGTGHEQVAEAIAAELDLALLAVDLGRLSRDEQLADTLAVLFREARLTGALLYLDRIDSLTNAEAGVVDEDLLAELAAHPRPVVSSGTLPWRASPLRNGGAPIGMVELQLDDQSSALRRAAWESELSVRGVGLDAEVIDELAARFRLTSAQIAEAAQTAAARGAFEGNRRTQRVARAFAAARDQAAVELGNLAVKTEPVYGWADIVVRDDVLAQLREMRSWVANREHVMSDWGFDRKLSRGKGTAALFAGPSGTGKTMAVEIIANDLGLDLYTIDLSGVVSKWIGETEKNLDRVFRAPNAVLCFDEADALFGKRSEVSDAHDRYANIEISYLLQKLETYEGLAVLTTNMLENIDEAFIRRLAFKVHFPFPEVGERRAIWERIWPADTPISEHVDFDALAAEFRLSGGNIKNVALSAAFLAAADGAASVGMGHVLHAVRRELGKMGKAVPDDEPVPQLPDGAATIEPR